MYVQVKGWSNLLEIQDWLFSSLPVAEDHMPHTKDVTHPWLMVEVARE